MDYPIPSHACSVWLAGDTLWAAFPPAPGHTKGHSLHFPATPEGFRIALAILRERATASDFRLGTPETPTQYDLAAIAKALERGTTAARSRLEAEEADKLLNELGLL